MKMTKLPSIPVIFACRNIMDLLSETRDKAADKRYLTGGHGATTISREQESARKTLKKKKPWNRQNLRILKLKIF